ncbi:hypothetical protein BC941DRAFT_416615 [Chlamydoabsidia padenii]|nr:hypothetical protein BC941DRAFT_416615 [Chlamydoabsidia padenii]
MLLQFLSDWKIDRQPNNKRRPCQPSTRRSSSMTSIESFQHCDNIDWHNRKQTWSFEQDYVSFPSLEPIESQDDDSQLQML